MPDTDITKKPKRKASDVVHTLAKAGLSAIPIVGGPASEVFSLVVTPSLEKRRDKWIESIAEALKLLEQKVKGFKIENLKDNEAFVSVVMQASQAAMRTHQEEKLEALRNAVLNSALRDSLEENLRLIFLNHVDYFTPLHLLLLRLISEATKKTFVDRNKIGRKIVQTENFGKRGEGFKYLFDEIAADLRSRALIKQDVGHSVWISCDEHQGWYDPITSLGEMFLQFIKSPIEGKYKGNKQ